MREFLNWIRGAVMKRKPKRRQAECDALIEALFERIEKIERR